jgi:hypothetical protein
MSTADVPDWTNPITEISGGSLTSDYPDWTQAVIDTGGGGGGVYASLTGAGETVTPGDLTQAGGLDVNDTAGTTGINLVGTSTAGAITIENSSSAGITIETTGATTDGVLIQNGSGSSGDQGGVLIQNLAPTGNISLGFGVSLQDLHANGVFVTGTQVYITSTSNAVVIDSVSSGVSIGTNAGFGTAHNGNNIGFFGHTPGVKPTVSGLKAGNAALGSLLTALSGLGLITDSSGP